MRSRVSSRFASSSLAGNGAVNSIDGRRPRFDRRFSLPLAAKRNVSRLLDIKQHSRDPTDGTAKSCDVTLVTRSSAGRSLAESESVSTSELSTDAQALNQQSTASLLCLQGSETDPHLAYFGSQNSPMIVDSYAFDEVADAYHLATPTPDMYGWESTWQVGHIRDD